MKEISLIQGSAEWAMIRCGRPTCSQADKILTPKKLQPSASAVGYRNLLLAEWLVGYPLDNARSAYMERGTEMEAEARLAYELEHGVEVRQVGFLLSDDARFGGSPDGVIGSDGIIEIKCPSMAVHVGYLLDPVKLEEDYRGQGQSLMYLSGRGYVDMYSYNPQLPTVTRRVTRDAEYIAAFDKALAAFLDDLDACREKLAPYRDEIARGDLPPELAALVA